MKKIIPSRWLLLAAAMFGAFALVAVACGGGDGGSGSDEDYVKAICNAATKFDESLDSASADAQEIFEKSDNQAEAEKKILELFAEPFSDFAKALDKANPPADIKASHEQLVDGLNTMVQSIEDGDDAALEAAGEALDEFEPSQEIQDRLAAVAANTSECKGTDFFE